MTKQNKTQPNCVGLPKPGDRMRTEMEMKREVCTPLEHLGGVATVIGLSMVLHVAITTGHGLLPGPEQLLTEQGSAIAAPASADWGHAVLRLNGMP
jgi:hypothetical protein